MTKNFTYEVLVLGPTFYTYEVLHLTSELTYEVFPAQRQLTENVSTTSSCLHRRDLCNDLHWLLPRTLITTSID